MLAPTLKFIYRDKGLARTVFTKAKLMTIGSGSFYFYKDAQYLYTEAGNFLLRKISGPIEEVYPEEEETL